jgi:hypothetical protein
MFATSGDLNCDGRPDVVVTHSDCTMPVPQHNAYTMMNDGFGQLAVITPADPGPDCLQASVPIVADLNGDGKADIIFPIWDRMVFRVLFQQ